MTVQWQYGVTTVPERRGDLLPKTLQSLQRAGFDKPRLFVDGCEDPTDYQKEFNLPVTARSPKVKVFSNWLLSFLELYLRDNTANFYALFQDDLVTYHNLRTYLEQCLKGEQTYWNLYTYPKNQERCDGSVGWFNSNQRGLGALALVFTQEGAETLLKREHMITRMRNASRMHRSTDGGIIETMIGGDYHEQVHNPSLVQHSGMKSQMPGKTWTDEHLATSFRGKDFDALELLKE